MYNYLICNKFKFLQNNKNINDIQLNTYMISVFDDGNQKYEKLKNEWMITDNVKPGKVSLLHKNSYTTIKSISSWKIHLIEDDKL